MRRLQILADQRTNWWEPIMDNTMPPRDPDDDDYDEDEDAEEDEDDEPAVIREPDE
jgi:hypothetical protein